MECHLHWTLVASEYSNPKDGKDACQALQKSVVAHENELGSGASVLSLFLTPNVMLLQWPVSSDVLCDRNTHAVHNQVVWLTIYRFIVDA